MLNSLLRAFDLTHTLNRLSLTGDTPAFASSFAVAELVQHSIAVAALAATELGTVRGVHAAPATVAVDLNHAEHECTGWFALDGITPEAWDPFAGIYPTGASDQSSTLDWIRIHTNFTHHRDGALALLGMSAKDATKADVTRKLKEWTAASFEDAAAKARMVATAMRTFAQWDASGQGQAIARQPLFSMERIGDSPKRKATVANASPTQPLAGLRVLDLTRILAGPTCGRTLATFGADVMLVNSPNLPNIAHIADTSRGKRSVHIDLLTSEGRAQLKQLICDTDVFVEGYRPGGLAALGFGPQDVAQMRPGIVYVSLSAYGVQGPWGDRRGFDSLTQTAMGFNHAEGLTFADIAGESFKPRAFPFQALDYATGFLMAACACAALRRQYAGGGSWLLRCSLAQTAQWLRRYPRTSPTAVNAIDRAPFVERTASGFGALEAIQHAARLNGEFVSARLESMPPGSHAGVW
jgi:hypothetical protein